MAGAEVLDGHIPLPEDGSPTARLITSDGHFFVQHKKGDQPQPIRDYLATAEAPLELINRIFSADGRWHYTDHSDPYTQSGSAISAVTSPVLRLIDHSLDKEHPFGFNDHGRRHIGAVKTVVGSLLQSKGADAATLRRGLLAAEFHDMGNLVSRDMHAALSWDIALRILPGLARDPQQAQIIREAIELHDPKEVYGRIAFWGRLTAEERIAYIRREFTQEALALFIADKTHIGRNRISQKANALEATEDKHVELNLLGETIHVGVSEDGKTFDWRLAFKPQSIESINQEIFTRRRSSQEGVSVRVSSATHKKHRQEIPSPHFHTWQQTFWTLGFDRNLFVVQAAFALFPEVEHVVISFHDTPIPGNYRIGRVATETFQQEHLDASIANLITMHVPKEKRSAMREKLLLSGNGG